MGIINKGQELYGDAVNTNNTPKTKYSFNVAMMGDGSQPDTEFVIGQVVSVNIPTINIETREVNQYNHYRNIKTRVKYDPVEVVFYDTANSLIVKLMRRIAGGFFKDSSLHEDGSVNQIIDPTVLDFVSTHGLTAVETKSRYKINKVIITHNAVGDYPDVKYNLYNVTFTSMRGDSLSYAENALATWTVTMEYEQLEIEIAGESRGFV